MSVLSGIFAEAVDQGLLAANPVQKVARRKREKVSDEGLKRVLSLDEIETLMNAATKRGLKWSALIGLGVYAGLRSGEALGLRWQDVDLEANIIRVRLQRDAKSGVLRDLKTEASRRDVPIATPLRRALVEWKLKSDYTELEHAVISTATGTSVSQRNALRTVCEVALSCGDQRRSEARDRGQAQPRLPLTPAHVCVGDDQGDEGRCGEGSPLDGARRHQGAARALLTRV